MRDKELDALVAQQMAAFGRVLRFGLAQHDIHEHWLLMSYGELSDRRPDGMYRVLWRYYRKPGEPIASMVGGLDEYWWKDILLHDEIMVGWKRRVTPIVLLNSVSDWLLSDIAQTLYELELLAGGLEVGGLHAAQ